MVSTAANYLRFAQIMMHGGALGGTRLLALATVRLITSNALKPGIGFVSTIPRFADRLHLNALIFVLGLAFFRAS